MKRGFRDELEILDRVRLDASDGRPSWYATCAAYLRSFQRSRHSTTSPDMPADQKITKACRQLYRMADPEQKAVMDGTSALSGRQKAAVFDELVARLAIMAGLTGCAIVNEPRKEINDE